MPILSEFDLFFYTSDLEKRRKFRQEVRCIAALYTRLFPRFETEDCRKIFIACHHAIKTERVVTSGNVAEIDLEFNLDSYFELNDFEKKKFILEILKQGIDKIVGYKAWNPKIFDDTYKKVLEHKYVNHYIWKKPKWNPTRKYNAEVLCEHELDAFHINIVIRDKDGQELKRVRVKSEIPDEWFFVEHLGKLTWSSKDGVTLTSKSGAKQWTVSI